MDAICENSLAQFGDALDGWPHGCEDAKESTWMNTMAEKVENVLWELARRQPARMSYQITSSTDTDRENREYSHVKPMYACMHISSRANLINMHARARSGRALHTLRQIPGTHQQEPSLAWVGLAPRPPPPLAALSHGFMNRGILTLALNESPFPSSLNNLV